MKKEEILQASRNENKKRDLAEIEIENKGVKIASIGIVILTTIYFCLEIFIKGETNYGWYSIIALYCAIIYGFKAVNDKKALHIINVVIWSFVTILCVVQVIRNIFATSNIM